MGPHRQLAGTHLTPHTTLIVFHLPLVTIIEHQAHAIVFSRFLVKASLHGVGLGTYLWLQGRSNPDGDVRMPPKSMECRILRVGVGAHHS